MQCGGLTGAQSDSSRPCLRHEIIWVADMCYASGRNHEHMCTPTDQICAHLLAADHFGPYARDNCCIQVHSACCGIYLHHVPQLQGAPQLLVHVAKYHQRDMPALGPDLLQC